MIRAVHLGLGNFFRAHQAWYTAASPGWEIAAFTGRSPGLATAMSAQGNRYTLITRGPSSDSFDVIDVVRQSRPGSDVEAWETRLAARETAVVTLTVTEAAYLRTPSGALDVDDPRARTDYEGWRRGEPMRSVPGRLVAGLARRRLAGSGPLSVVSCDNLPSNGSVTARVVLDFAGLVEPALVPWIHDHVAFVTTMVDRITPRSTPADVRAAASATGFGDATPVVTEPYTEWVLSGEFPAGRPRWEEAGARFVPDVHPHEQRKLLLLNGAHSLLAYAGSLRGHTTVADAVDDPVCAGWLHQWWDEARRLVPLPAGDLEAYVRALTTRFRNGRIRHTLAQIAADGSQKIPIRVVPVLRAERLAGRLPAGAIRAVASWIAHLRGEGVPIDDAGADPYRARAHSVREVLSLLAPDLATDPDLIKALEDDLT